MTSSIQKLFRIIFLLHDLSTFTDLIFLSELINNYSRGRRATPIFSTRTKERKPVIFSTSIHRSSDYFFDNSANCQFVIFFYTFASPLTANRSSVISTNGITVDFLHGIPWRNKGNQISAARVGQPE
jgi:hypothetical protein